MSEYHHWDDGKIHDKNRLQELRELPLERKVGITLARITEWYQAYNGQVYVSFSGGKDSTVLLYLARSLFPDIKAVFIDTGLEYPEIRKFATSFPNVTVLRPEMRFDEVIKRYGYPIISKEVAQKISEYRSKPDGYTAVRFENDNPHCLKYGSRYSLFKWKPLRDSNIPISHKCCKVMKKTPALRYEKLTGEHPIIATLTEESSLRRSDWLRHGCNAFDARRPKSNPMSFWTEQDVLRYIKTKQFSIASVYGEVVQDKHGKYKTTGCTRTGCIFCGFGCHNESPGRFELLKETHPRQYDYCIGGGEFGANGMWQPNRNGLGLGYVFDLLNEMYGTDFVKY